MRGGAGSRAIIKGKAAEWGLSLYTPVIVKYRDERPRDRLNWRTCCVEDNSHNQNRFLIAFLALAGITSVLWAITHNRDGNSPLSTGGISLGCDCGPFGYAFFRRSLTPWIFAGMLVGAEIGFDLTFVSDATRLKVAATYKF